MADSQSLGEIVVSIIADTTKLDSGLNKANQSISKFDKTGKSAAKNTETLQKSLDKTGKESEETGKSIGELTQQEKQQGTAAQKAAGQNEQNNEELKKTKSAADEAKKAYDGFKKVLGVLGISLGVKELIDKFKELVEKIHEANQEYQDYVKQMNQSVGANYVMGERAKQLYTETLSNSPYEKEDIQKAAAYVAKVYADTSDEIQKALMDEFLAQNYMGQSIGASDISTNMNQFNTIAKKYELTDDEMAESLTYLRATTQDANISLTDLESSMLTLEDYAKVMGLTFKEVADMIAAAADAGNLDDINTLGSSFTSAYANAMDKMKAEILAEEGNTLQGAELQKYVSNSVTNLFKNGLDDAMKSGDKFNLGAYLADTLGISAAKTTGIAAGILSTQTDTTDRTNRDNLISSQEQLSETIGRTESELKKMNENVAEANRINEEYQQNLTKARASELAVRQVEGNAAGTFKGLVSDRDARNEEVKKALEGEAEWTVETAVQAFSNALQNLNPMKFVGDSILGGVEDSLDAGVIQNYVDEINSKLGEIEPGNVEEMIKVLEEGRKELEKLGDTTDIDTTSAVQSLEDVIESISGDEGLNSTLDGLMISLDRGVIKIDSSVIPANSRLISSNDAVAASYRRIAEAKAAAGM